MKKQLAYDKHAGQFKTDIGNPPMRFRLGSDANTAQERKIKLVAFWGRCQADGWTPFNIGVAKAIAKGESVDVLQRTGEDDSVYFRRLESVASVVGDAVKMKTTITVDDLHVGEIALLKERNAVLEALLKQHVGNGAVDGLKITVHQALDAYHQYRAETEIDPDTGKMTEHVRTEKNNIAFVKRQIGEQVKLTALSFIEIQRWCKAIAGRPKSLKTGNPIKRLTVRNCLKVIRQFCRWASHNYGWKKPEEWHEATKMLVRRTAGERREDLANVEKYYTPEELGTLWRYAIPSERLLMMLALNFGYVYSEIKSLQLSDLAGKEMAALRSKTESVGRWVIWDETRELASKHWNSIPDKRQNIANKWTQLLDRVTKAEPDFKRLSFKWLRKSGASMLRRIGGGELASLYISHGESASTPDALLEVYASANWGELCKALEKMREQLLPFLSAEAPPTRTYIPLNVIEKIKHLWSTGMKPEDIAVMTGKSRATVYRYRPANPSTSDAG